jgi:ribosomal protein S27AE
MSEKQTYPDGVPIFPDDTPCPKCGYHTVLLHSHGDIALECPKCDWYKTVDECMMERAEINRIKAMHP